LETSGNKAARRSEPAKFILPGSSHCYTGIGIRLERGDMARSELVNRLPLAVATALSIFVVLSASAAHAADPGFCKQYTQAALNQVRVGLITPRCARGLQGARWSTEFAIHYEWCLGASLAAAGVERDERTRFLRACNVR
jgi:hypothetical protein